MSDKDVSAFIRNYVAQKEEIETSEVRAALLGRILDELEVDEETFRATELARPALMRGCSAFIRDTIKKPESVEALLEDDAQVEMFGHGAEFMHYANNADGGGRFRRRRAMTKEQYGQGLALLDKKEEEIKNKSDRYRADYQTAHPHWGPGMTFGEAYQQAKRSAG